MTSSTAHDTPNPHKLTSPSEINQKLATKILQRLGCRSIATAHNGQHALDYLSGPFPRPDIIFMDISMPVMDGIQATHIIRTQLPFIADPKIQRTPIIGLVACMGICLREDQKAGFNVFLKKPLRVDHLRRQLTFWAREEIMPLPGGTGGSPGLMVGLKRRYRGPRSRI
ncbi:hypothetical protein BO70DRAFT_364651 [Aspergillus heteromorphus CBS 117.55]|uniref:Response regulatory domain-containing protein n=1 Tax=Aspergillus heteromorphus CBS 117.55 TaxID=1448321 RepID=A0A317VIJ3_9EURO|nr:uncharacterized protein BO70DRAFT_364651 [Aspergillus heteromorphus CBS 117.55]PWY73735.1 hypothetical protein BO70DRAFT_364651 [Aspergillus heteromorphus CBS 117.55]